MGLFFGFLDNKKAMNGKNWRPFFLDLLLGGPSMGVYFWASQVCWIAEAQRPCSGRQDDPESRVLREAFWIAIGRSFQEMPLVSVCCIWKVKNNDKGEKDPEATEKPYRKNKNPEASSSLSFFLFL